ncbi:MAG: hypothetical protein NZ480_01025 [Bdellovibrionaceae bacterium]|nr:hypothetical protein [Pseudobdellovibrionaceae bacterium]MDW8189933.1 hypothetical protein [Pseudobdellovibrionaceae bacterium]
MTRFHTVFIEEDLKNHPVVHQCVSRLSYRSLVYIDSYQRHFYRIQKPYLKKREKLNLFLARKKGDLVKVAPDSYGRSGDFHYYYVHFYNCIYECQYCYLQGYFKSPDLVAFVNYEDIIQQMQLIVQKHVSSSTSGRVWFHGGEFSDSLALSSLISEIPYLYPFFKSEPQALWELRTKSVHVNHLKKFTPLPNWFISFSLSPPSLASSLELRVPSPHLRIKAMKQLMEYGYQLGLHLDPVTYVNDFENHYCQLFTELASERLLPNIQYISLGVVRFSKEVGEQVQRNYPDSLIFQHPMVLARSGKLRYPKLLREEILLRLYRLLLDFGVDPQRIYFCMEN